MDEEDEDRIGSCERRRSSQVHRTLNTEPMVVLLHVGFFYLSSVSL